MNEDVIIIAEAGVNHNGDMELAKQLIDVASESGADYVKFQSFTASKLVSQQAKKAAYQKKNIGNGDDSQFSMLKKLELSSAHHDELITYCQLKKIEFLSTAFDVEGLRYLKSLNLKIFKIPSGEITNYPYLEQLSSFNRKVILSTGMATINEIKEAVLILTSGKLTRDDITILHCNTEYPTPMEDVNLKAMLDIKDKLGVKVGYSDHTLGIEVPIAAVALGACVIEKHFTLNRNLSGPDHQASLEPQELKTMVTLIRNIELAISGSGTKEPSNSELKNIEIARKSIHLSKALKKGDIIHEEDLIPLRPGSGISPMQWTTVIGKYIIRDLPENHLLCLSDLI